jgi:hypothetical protein
MSEHKQDPGLTNFLTQSDVGVEAYHWCVDRNICPTRFFFPLVDFLSTVANDRSINDKVEAKKARLLSQAFDHFVVEEPIYLDDGKLFRPDSSPETTPMLRFEKDMWKLAQRLDWIPYGDSNKPEPAIWRTKNSPCAECVVTKSSSPKKTLPNLEKATADFWKILLEKMFANLANPEAEVMHNITEEDLEAVLGDEDKSRLLTWTNSNNLQEDLPDGVLDVIWRMFNERLLYPEAYDNYQV